MGRTLKRGVAAGDAATGARSGVPIDLDFVMAELAAIPAGPERGEHMGGTDAS